MHIGPYQLDNPIILAPMAGITDLPFRRLCRELGAGMAVSEMVTANSLLWNSKKTRQRTSSEGETGPVSVQIAGSDPAMLAEAARYNVDQGAQIVDINMGCPAKKVCSTMAGSALLRDEALVGRILDAVVKAVDVPVTLKIRTGWDMTQRNGLQIARIAEAAGVQTLAVHGRTRACGYRGEAEYDTIKAIKEALTIPVIANGDITTPEKARFVLEFTGADAVMIGRGAQGNPWIFREINHYLNTGHHFPLPTVNEIYETLIRHLRDIYAFYGEHIGVRVARKHICWYTKSQPQGAAFRQAVNKVNSCTEQLAMTQRFFEGLAEH